MAPLLVEIVRIDHDLNGLPLCHTSPPSTILKLCG
jgi:hypothetical protein